VGEIFRNSGTQIISPVVRTDLADLLRLTSVHNRSMWAVPLLLAYTASPQLEFKITHHVSLVEFEDKTPFVRKLPPHPCYLVMAGEATRDGSLVGSCGQIGYQTYDVVPLIIRKGRQIDIGFDNVKPWTYIRSTLPDGTFELSDGFYGGSWKGKLVNDMLVTGNKMTPRSPRPQINPIRVDGRNAASLGLINDMERQTTREIPWAWTRFIGTR